MADGAKPDDVPEDLWARVTDVFASLTDRFEKDREHAEQIFVQMLAARFDGNDILFKDTLFHALNSQAIAGLVIEQSVRYVMMTLDGHHPEIAADNFSPEAWRKVWNDFAARSHPFDCTCDRSTSHEHRDAKKTDGRY